MRGEGGNTIQSFHFIEGEREIQMSEMSPGGVNSPGPARGLRFPDSSLTASPAEKGRVADRCTNSNIPTERRFFFPQLLCAHHNVSYFFSLNMVYSVFPLEDK